MWITAGTLQALHLGGHVWVYLNWALGLRAAGCRVVWLEVVSDSVPDAVIAQGLPVLHERLARFGLRDVACARRNGGPIAETALQGTVPMESGAEADLLLNQVYSLSPELLRPFRRTVLLDIDPGLLQLWMSRGELQVAPHDLYFSTGETVGTPAARFPDCGLRWEYTPPVVALEAWPVAPAPPGAPYTTVTNWWGEWMTDAGGLFDNAKRASFRAFADVAGEAPAPLELAVFVERDEVEERAWMEARGWSIRYGWEVGRTLETYRAYIQGSRGEFSCAKPSCMRLANAWVSDRTLCYLASGKPAVVQHTGPSRILPDGEGLFRFTDPPAARAALAAVEADYDRHARAARALAEERFDARRVAGRLLERALP